MKKEERKTGRRHFVGAKKVEDARKGGAKRETDTMTTSPRTTQEQTGKGWEGSKSTGSSSRMGG